MIKFLNLKIINQEILIQISIAVLAGSLFYLYLEYWHSAVLVASRSSELCSSVEERPLKIAGNSLSGVVENGAVIKILMGYYKCQSVKKGDLVVYNYPGAEPLIKIAQAVEGDKFHLQKSETENVCWNLIVNGELAKNSEGKPYCFGDRASRMISLYEQNYGGVIPKDALLILGNLTKGSLDSTRFGLVGRYDLLGKVIQ